jgi:hypothetical protein
MNLSIYRTLRTPIRWEVSEREFLFLSEFLYLITKLGVFKPCVGVFGEIHIKHKTVIDPSKVKTPKRRM